MMTNDFFTFKKSNNAEAEMKKYQLLTQTTIIGDTRELTIINLARIR